MILDTSNRKSIRAVEKAAAVADRERGVTVANLMSTIPGRRYIWEKLTAAHMFQTSFNADPLQMAFNEGERNQGIQLLNDIIQWCPEQYIQAMRESNERNSSDHDSRTGTDAGERGGREDGDGGDQGSAGDAASGFSEPGAGEDRDEARH